MGRLVPVTETVPVAGEYESPGFLITPRLGLVPPAGFEPATYGLMMEFPASHWRAQLQSSAKLPKAVALSTELRRHNIRVFTEPSSPKPPWNHYTTIKYSLHTNDERSALVQSDTRDFLNDIRYSLTASLPLGLLFLVVCV